MRYGSTRQTAGLTVVILKDGRIVPVDHLVDSLSGDGETAHQERPIYKVTELWFGVLVCKHMTGLATPMSCCITSRRP